MIEVKNLYKKYGDFAAVRGVDFKVKKGRILGFLGPNGAGKTTTMRIITGYMPATSGSVTIGTHDIFTKPMEARRHMGYLPEIPPLYPDLTVRQYLRFVAKIKGVPRREVEANVDRVIDQCGVRDYENKRIAVMSKGYKQRVGLAQALVSDPEVLILDEPTIGLDPNQIKEIRGLIRSLAGDHTVILSTHILPEVTMTCDDVVIIDQGRVVAADTLENLTKTGGGRARTYLRLAEPNEKTRRLLEDTPGVAKVEPGAESGVFLVTGEPNLDPSPDIALLVMQQGWGLLEMRHERPTLEEIFAQLTIGAREGASHA
ncbi:MAG: ATP-binding cassette domain-containing protein [Candidatus Lernaella stagnicola]|nr:ATP-binding cassette domain-containing protein [Candidatus Lernaella stagnicola]